MSSTQPDLEIAGHRVPAGERRHLWLPLGQRPDGTALGVPVIVVHGAQPGTRLGITTGIHGDEYEGAEGVRRFLAQVDPGTLRGAIIATPQANPLAFERGQRVGHVDDADLNRLFPGRADGFLTERIAHVVMGEIVGRVDTLVDVHSAGLAFDLVPYVGFNSTPGSLGETSFALAKATGIDVLYASTPFGSAIRAEASRRGVSAILIEAGGQGRLNSARVAQVTRSLLNVAGHLGLVPGRPEALPAVYQIVQAPAHGEFVHAPTGGFLLPDVRLGDRVGAGQALARLVDPFGVELGRIESPVDGRVIIARTSPAVRVGDWAYAVLRVVGEVTRDTPLTALSDTLGGPAQ